jgi:hypothetical protein
MVVVMVRVGLEQMVEMAVEMVVVMEKMAVAATMVPVVRLEQVAMAGMATMAVVEPATNFFFSFYSYHLG